MKRLLNVILMFFVLVPFFIGCSDKDSNDDTTLLLAYYLLTQTSKNGTYSIADTNQSSCFDSNSGSTKTCSKTGMDADYQGNIPSYSKSSDGKIITDNVTGLMWTQSTDINGDGSVNDSDKKYQSEAISYCDSLSLGGYDDWRLPDVKTLYSLIEFSGKDASSNSACSGGSGTCDTSTLTLFIDTGYFDKAFGDTSAGDRVIDGQYATTTNYVSTTMNGDATMFGLNFVDGRIKGYPVNTKKFYVRCVRGNTDYGINSFTDNGDQTINDSATGLMWQKDDSSSTGWDNAISVCEAATTGNHSDWRLPNAKELQSILDYTRSPDTSSSAAISSIFNSTSFTNENGVTDYGYYWSSTTHMDNDGDGKSGVYISFGRASGYFNNQYLDVHGAGAQRSNYKNDVSITPGASTANLGQGTFYYHGPQGDILRNANRVRCVRTM